MHARHALVHHIVVESLYFSVFHPIALPSVFLICDVIDLGGEEGEELWDSGFIFSLLDYTELSSFFLFQFCPKWVAPNLLTFSGFLFTVLNFFLFAYYDYDFYASSVKHPEADPIPRWVWLIAAINIFLAYTLDGIDGKQARKTQTSGPLGELFDHGLDSWTAILIPVCMYSVFGRGPESISTLRFYFCLWNVFINFYLSHWEKYNTGQLFLPWGYDASMVRKVSIEHFKTAHHVEEGNLDVTFSNCTSCGGGKPRCHIFKLHIMWRRETSLSHFQTAHHVEEGNLSVTFFKLHIMWRRETSSHFQTAHHVEEGNLVVTFSNCTSCGGLGVEEENLGVTFSNCTSCAGLGVEEGNLVVTFSNCTSCGGGKPRHIFKLHIMCRTRSGGCKPRCHIFAKIR
uniref:Uncharacterized protein n=1 Tax=Timema tahoe TaxID=61484 RepID=A0A7R9FLG5_9NEOP|nr:unnamed protein product [Timema tahoe]